MSNYRRLYNPGPDLRKPASTFNLPIKICLISAVSLILALMLFIMYTGTAILFVHFWVYVAVAALILLLLLGAGVLAIIGRIKGSSGRRIAGIALGGVMLMLAGFAFSIVSIFFDIQKPVAFYDSPEKENRIVVMLTDDVKGKLVSAYPAIGNHFYVAVIDSGMIHSNGVITGVEWEGERLAKVQLEDIDGNDAELVVDFAPLYSGETAAE